MIVLIVQSTLSTSQSSTQTCSLSSRDEYCSQCPSGYYLKVGVCQPCANSCQICTQPIFCLQCIPSYNLDSWSLCDSCNNGDRCIYCSKVLGHCLLCQPGYYYWEQTQFCRQCIPQCSTCLDVSTCTDCALKYYYSQNMCKPCPAFCLTCSQKQLCSSCAVGSILLSDTCKQCADGCLTCQRSDQNCSSCKSGHFLDNNLCLPCQHPCFECRQRRYCTSCILGYYLNPASGSCLFCSGISNCLYCISQSACTQCVDGFQIIDNACEACPPGCQSCVLEYCFVCSTNYYFKDYKQCKSCPLNCAFCQQLVCTKCSPNYIISNGQCVQGPSCSLSKGRNQQNICVDCPEGCDTCQNSNVCLKCLPPYFLGYDDGICYSCPQNCRACLQGYCLICKAYYCFSINGCQKCNFYDCINSLYGFNCDLCKPGFFVTISNLCLPCLKGTERCADPKQGSAMSCSNGYFLQLNDNSLLGTCKPCVNGCFLCQSALVCKLCSQGYILNGNTCVVCPKGCKICDSNFCYACIPGYFQSGGNYCIRCAYSCMTCRSLNQCTFCIEGFYLADNRCLQCGNGICIKPREILGCNFGYYLASGNTQCIACSLPCLSCTSSACYSCSREYYVKDLKCWACQKNCLHCQESGCLSCIQTFALIRGVCVQTSTYTLSPFTKVKPSITAATINIINKTQTIVFALIQALLLALTTLATAIHFKFKDQRKTGKIERHQEEQDLKCSKCGKLFLLGEEILRTNCAHLFHISCVNQDQPLLCILCTQ